MRGFGMIMIFTFTNTKSSELIMPHIITEFACLGQDPEYIVTKVVLTCHSRECGNPEDGYLPSQA